MIPYEKAFTTDIIFGQERHYEVGNYVRKYSANILFLYGGGSIRRTGLYDDVIRSLEDNGIRFTELGGIRSNPDISLVRQGIRMVRENKIDFLLAVGGGSVIDTAKGIAAGFFYNGDPWDLCNGVEVEKALPIGTVLTIPGTGSETSPNMVLNNDETHEKKGNMAQVLRPVFAILDPTLCLTIPKKAVPAPVFDMLSHTMERYFSETPHTDVIDGVAEGIMRGIIKNGIDAYCNPQDVDAWAELMIGADFSHNGMAGFGKQGDWANHPMEEVISGVYDFVPHGAGLAVITLAWMKYVYRKHVDIFAQFAMHVMGVNGSLLDRERIARQGIEALEDFCHKMDLPTRMQQLGIDDSQYEYMAKKCCENSEGTVGHLEKLTWQDVLAIYRLASEE